MSSDAPDAVYGANARQIQGRTHQVGTLPCAVVRDWRADVWVLNSKIHLTQDDLLFFLLRWIWKTADERTASSGSICKPDGAQGLDLNEGYMGHIGYIWIHAIA